MLLGRARATARPSMAGWSVSVADHIEVPTGSHLERRQRLHQEFLRRCQTPEAFLRPARRLEDRGQGLLMYSQDLQHPKAVADGAAAELIRALTAQLAAAQEVIEQRRAILPGEHRDASGQARIPWPIDAVSAVRICACQAD